MGEVTGCLYVGEGTDSLSAGEAPGCLHLGEGNACFSVGVNKEIQTTTDH